MTTVTQLTRSRTDGDRPEQLELGERIEYVGKVTPLGPAVFVMEDDVGKPLQLAETVGGRGYSWGRAGSRARELSRAILIDATGNEMLAERLCRPFTWELVSELPAAGFQLSKEDVLAWVEDYQLEAVESSSRSVRRGRRGAWLAPRVAATGI